MAELIWPIVDDVESATEAAHYAGAWSGILAGLNLLAAFAAGLYPPSLLAVCAIFGIGAWRIWEGSEGWAVTAFALCVVETIAVLLRMPLMWGIAMPFAFLALMNGVRATTALGRFARQPFP
ncbi:MAG TPA: hypothetical protein VFR84_00755 [Candidatus Angelobacter sp.]|nr:hypothetical protein [Candidatus Angelobacter sp.]